jgi:hypothetical protein
LWQGLWFHVGHIDRHFKRFNKKSVAVENAALRKNAAIAGVFTKDLERDTEFSS